MPDDPFRVLFICTGNQCRSPFAAGLLRQLADAAPVPVEVDSAGLVDNPPTPSPQRMVETALAEGVDLSEHRSRPLSDTDCASYDLVIGFERQHVATAVVDGGARPDRTFLLAELVRLVNGMDGAGDPRAVVADAAARRMGAGFVPGEELDDPIGRSAADYQRVAGEVADLVRALQTSLFGAETGARDDPYEASS